MCCLKVIQLTLWPEELRRRWAVISLCLWRLHAVFVSLLQRNWYRLTLLSLTEPHHSLTLRSLTAVGLRVLSSHKITQACVQTHTHTLITPSWLLARSQLKRSRAELVRLTLMEMSCLVSSTENWAELMLISSQQRSTPEGGSTQSTYTEFKSFWNQELSWCLWGSLLARCRECFIIWSVIVYETAYDGWFSSK